MILMRRALAALLLLPLLAACGTKPAPLPKPGTAAKSVDSRIVSGNDRFGIHLLQAIKAQQGLQNMLLSPPSASLALSLAANGATGQTQSEILKALGLEGMTLAELNAGNRELQSVLANPDKKVELQVANSLWVKEGRPLAKPFVEMARNDYRAVAANVPFGDPKAAAQINDWVKEATKGKIPSLVERTQPADRLYIVNALYFNGTWTEPFEPDRTNPEPFTKLDGSAKQVPMMHQGGRFRYLAGAGFQAAALPFGEGRLSLYLFRPDETVGLEGFLAKLTPENWSTWMKSFAPKQGAIALPKFKLEAGADLIPALKELGMNHAFDAKQAEFPAFFAQNPEPLFIGLVKQKTFLSVDERGAEAAAATVVGLTAGSAPPTDPFNLRLDHPFFLAIRDDQTGALLFLGTVVDP
jgi:serpin B